MVRQLIQGLEPKRLWHHFFSISQIPRCSRHEEKVREYVRETAKQNGLAYRMDATGNLVVTANASEGRQACPVVVLQGHLDMVCEKEKGRQHDFEKDPVSLKREGDWMGAEGTTLGADNGIGVAASLAVLESKALQHGPLECLFTVDEETGLTGAMGLDRDLLKGRMLINMDTEEHGAIYIGCAGGKDTELLLDIETEEAPSSSTAVRVRIGGLQGGHSGIDIHRGRGNAIKLLTRFLWKQTGETDLRVAGINGGSKHNAIPRDCEAIVRLPAENLPALKSAGAQYGALIGPEYALSDPGVFLSVDEQGFDKPSAVFTPAFQKHVLNTLYALPTGIMSMSQAVADLVQTSNNLAIVETGASRIRLVTSQRSSVKSELEDVSTMICAIGQQAEAEILQGNAYPPWNPNPGSPLLNDAKSAYKSLFGVDPQVKAVHAGLECGIIGDSFPGMDMISFGPTIQGAHSPTERVQISTVENFWNLLVGLLERLAA
jgi:dipeptidase D